jgi:hypothetical protein
LNAGRAGLHATAGAVTAAGAVATAGAVTIATAAARGGTGLIGAIGDLTSTNETRGEEHDQKAGEEVTASHVQP